MEEIIRKAIDRVASNRTGEEKEKILAETQKELDRLMKEHRAVKTKAQLLESNKNELAETIHSLQRELELKGELEEERLHKKFVEGHRLDAEAGRGGPEARPGQRRQA
jgi:hypothetical protein